MCLRRCFGEHVRAACGFVHAVWATCTMC
jgi:hypothetical protein